jgi:hypothetical protein
MKAKTCFAILALLAGTLLTAGVASAQEPPTATFRVLITNLTPHQILSPPVVATHSYQTRIFHVATPASPELTAVAEDALNDGLVALLENSGEALSVVVGDGVIPPGQTATLEVEANTQHPLISVVGMLVTTNDAFYGLDSEPLIDAPRVQRITVPAYDAGTENNNELCEFIPGPPCENIGVRNPEGAEGFIHIHDGIHGIGDLATNAWDWKNPVALITIVRIGL